MRSSALGTALWKNARDSIRHALDHFSELQVGTADRDYHIKWAVLSVHHAAEHFCTMLLIEVAPGHPVLPRTDTSKFPGLRKVLEIFKKSNLTQRLSPSERRVLELFGHLAEPRDQIMHRTLPDDLEASVAAMSLLGLLRIARRRIGEKALDDIVRQSPEVEADIFRTIRYMRVEEYCRFAEQLLREEYPDACLEQCPNCGTASILAGHCEVCFEEMACLDCPETEEPVFYPSWQRFVHECIEVECPHCGKTHTA